jgi:hypothetical protein
MNWIKCDDCDDLINSDTDPDCLVYAENYKRQHAKEVVCAACRKKRWSDLTSRYDPREVEAA